MPAWLMKTGDDEYFEWSTVVDRPVGEIVDRASAVEAWGEEQVRWTDEHLCSCRARLGERIDVVDGEVVVSGGGKLAYHFNDYQEVIDFLSDDEFNINDFREKA